MVPVLNPHHQRGVADEASLPRSEDAFIDGSSARPLAVLGRRGDLGRPHEHPQSAHRRERTRLVHRADSAGRRTRTTARPAPIILRRRSRR